MTVVPPTNTSAAAAYLISSIPDLFTEDLSGNPSEVWFSYKPGSSETAFGIMAYGDAALTTYVPRIYVYYGSPGSLTSLMNAYAVPPNVTRPMIVPVVAGRTHYMKLTNWVTPAPDLTGVTLSFDVDPAPTESMVAGSLLINDDTSENPLVILDPSDGHVRSLVNPFPAGERGDAIASGYFLFHDSDGVANTDLNLYDINLNLVADLTVVNSSPDPFISGGFASKFYVGQYDSGAATIQTISVAGAVGANTWSLPGIADEDAFSGMAVSPNETVLYYGIFSGLDTLTINRWDLVNDIALSAFSDISGADAFTIGRDIKVMSDGTILVQVSYTQALRFDTSGNILNTYTFATDLNRIALDIDPDYFWAWSYPASFGISTYSKIKASDGSVSLTFNRYEFAAGIYSNNSGSSSYTPDRFGVSNSCPLVVGLSGITSLSPSTSPSVSPSGSPSGSPSSSPSTALLPINPYVMLSWSDDGGMTWSNEYWRPVGKVGEHRKRLIWRQLGRAKDRVFKMAVSDPCNWIFIDAWIDAEEGTSRR